MRIQQVLKQTTIRQNSNYNYSQDMEVVPEAGDDMGGPETGGDSGGPETRGYEWMVFITLGQVDVLTVEREQDFSMENVSSLFELSYRMILEQIQ